MTTISLFQYKVLQNVRQVPKELIGVIDSQTLTKARDYNIDKTRFGFVADVYGQIRTVIVLWFEVIPLLWRLSGRVVLRFGLKGDTELIQTVVFVFIGHLAAILADLPISLYWNFIVEQKHGFNTQTIGFYAKDRLKKFVVMQALLAPIICAGIHIIQTTGHFFFLYLWIFSLVVTLLLITVYPDLIAPLFDSFTPLPEGQLKKDIEKMAADIGFPLKKIYVVEGSKRSSHSNAYFFGFYKNKRIVLFDTLFEDYYKQNKAVGHNSGSAQKSKHQRIGCTNDEILAVLAHELGHWYLSHAMKYVVIAQTILLVYFWFYSNLYQNTVLYKAFGFSYVSPVFIGVFLTFRFVFWPLNELLSFAVMCFSRHFEYGSDSFAKKLKRGPDLRKSLIKLYRDNLGFPVYDWLYSHWNHSHPTLLQRLKSLSLKTK